MSGDDSGITPGNQQSLDQTIVSNTIAVNEANAASSFDAESNNSSFTFSSFPKKLNEDKQGKHIPGHKNYQNGKSELTINISDASKLVGQFSGKGTPISNNKERVDFGKIIGIYKDPTSGTGTPTSIGIIHYSKFGTHIVPAKPKEA